MSAIISPIFEAEALLLVAAYLLQAGQFSRSLA
jgi:hypothetical protein